MIKVLVVDDERLLRAGLRAMLEAEPDLRVVGEAADGAEAVDVALATHPDVVLIDVRMPGVDGIEGIRRLRRTALPARVLVMTTFDLDEYVYEALSGGAVGFLLKDASPDRLVDGVRRTARGETVLDPSVVDRFVRDFLARPGPDLAARGRLAALSERELEVLRLLAHGCSNGEVAEQLFLSEGTVKTHVTSLLGKLGLSSRLKAVVLAYEVGLVRPGEVGLLEG